MANTEIGEVENTVAWLPCPICHDHFNCEVTVKLSLEPRKPGDVAIPLRAHTTVNTWRLWRHYTDEHGPLDPFTEEETQKALEE